MLNHRLNPNDFSSKFGESQENINPQPMIETMSIEQEVIELRERVKKL
jgi:hypothetical protein